MPLRKAAVEGSKEIFFAVISTSLTLAVVFMPVIFLTGICWKTIPRIRCRTGRGGIDFGFCIAHHYPVLNVVLTRKNASHGKFYERTEPFFRGMENGYRRLLEGFLKIRWFAWVIIAVCAVIVVLSLNNLKSELAPLEDRSSIRFTATAPEGTSFSYMSNISDSIADYLYDSVPERDFVFVRTPAGPSNNTSQPRIGLVPTRTSVKDRRHEIANDLQRKLNRFIDARIFVIQEQTIAVGSGSRTSLPVQFVLQNQDLDKLKEAIPKFLAEVRKDKTFSNVDVNLKFNKPELDITLDRIKIKDLGSFYTGCDLCHAVCIQRRKTGLFYSEWISVPGDRAGRKIRPQQTDGYFKTICAEFKRGNRYRFHRC